MLNGDESWEQGATFNLPCESTYEYLAGFFCFVIAIRGLLFLAGFITGFSGGFFFLEVRMRGYH